MLQTYTGTYSMREYLYLYLATLSRNDGGWVSLYCCDDAETKQKYRSHLSGFLGRSRTWSLMMVSSLPSMGGTIARPPVAIKMFLACTTIVVSHVLLLSGVWSPFDFE